MSKQPFSEAEIIQEPADQPKAETVTDTGMALQIYQQVGVVPFDKDVVEELAKWETANETNHLEEMYDILPTGEIYLSQVHYRKILNSAFGRGGWAMVPIDKKPYARAEGSTQLVQEWALIAHGRFISQTEGGAEYNPDNARQLWSDACETVRSNALMRLCKDLSLASDCWDRRFIAKWKAKYATQVWVAKKYKAGNEWKVKGDLQWRRIDAEPLRGELRPVKDGETSINVAEPKFGVFEIIEDRQVGHKPEPEKKAPRQTQEKPQTERSAPPPQSAPLDEERFPLRALAMKAGHGNFFTTRGVTIVSVTKKPMMQADGKTPKADGKGNVQYTYTAYTDLAEPITTFSGTDANALNKAAKEKRTLDLQCKAVLKQSNQDGSDLWFINLDEIVGEA